MADQPVPPVRPSWLALLGARYQDLLQVRFTARFAALPATALESVSPANPIKRLAKMVGYAGRRLIGHLFQPIHNSETLTGAVWLYVVSQNNVEALRFIRQALPEARLVAGQGKQIGRYTAEVNRLSLRRKILYYWQFPLACWTAARQHGWLAWRFFDLIFGAVGYYEVYRRALRHYQPRAVIFANDHNDDARALLLACQAEGVPTAYVQHASVTKWFPPLSFDLSLLEGQHALDIYRACGPVAGRVALVGMPKADIFVRQRNQAPKVRRVAIAANQLDPTPALLNTLDTLLPALPDLQFTFRAHPADPRDFRALLATRYPRLQFSDARTESVFTFLHQHDALVAADTSTHLEATLLNIASIYYRFGPSDPLTDDYYGYVRHGVVITAPTSADLIAHLTALAHHKPRDLYQRAAYYCATIGTQDDGQAETLALRELTTWLANPVSASRT